MTSRGDGLPVLAVAIALDWLVGEPPAAAHPVVWIGRLVAVLERRAPASPAGRLAWGTTIVTATVGATVLAARLVEVALRQAPPPFCWLLLAALLKPAFAVRELFAAVGRVERALAADDLPTARAALRHLVSRDVRDLDATLLAAAAIESLAENASDSVVAPLLYAALFGLPGAYAYRAINTLDAMIGYHGPYEHLGKPAARLDDLANLLPARITAGLLVLAAPVVGARRLAVCRRLPIEAARTLSPNAGWPMGAAALALDRQLEKRQHYRLNPTGRAPAGPDLIRARRLVGTALALGAGLGLVAWLAGQERMPDG